MQRQEKLMVITIKTQGNINEIKKMLNWKCKHICEYSVALTLQQNKKFIENF